MNEPGGTTTSSGQLRHSLNTWPAFVASGGLRTEPRWAAGFSMTATTLKRPEDRKRRGSNPEQDNSYVIGQSKVVPYLFKGSA